MVVVVCFPDSPLGIRSQTPATAVTPAGRPAKNPQLSVPYGPQSCLRQGQASVQRQPSFTE